VREWVAHAGRRSNSARASGRKRQRRGVSLNLHHKGGGGGRLSTRWLRRTLDYFQTPCHKVALSSIHCAHAPVLLLAKIAS
jgi:hypothetical protein